MSCFTGLAGIYCLKDSRLLKLIIPSSIDVWCFPGLKLSPKVLFTVLINLRTFIGKILKIEIHLWLINLKLRDYFVIELHFKLNLLCVVYHFSNQQTKYLHMQIFSYLQVSISGNSFCHKRVIKVFFHIPIIYYLG